MEKYHVDGWKNTMKYGSIGKDNKGSITDNFRNVPKTSMCMCRRCGAFLNRDKRKEHMESCPGTPLPTKGNKT